MTARLTRKQALGFWVAFGRACYANSMSLEQALADAPSLLVEAAIKMGYSAAEIKYLTRDGVPVLKDLKPCQTSPEKEH